MLRRELVRLQSGADLCQKVVDVDLRHAQQNADLIRLGQPTVHGVELDTEERPLLQGLPRPVLILRGDASSREDADQPDDGRRHRRCCCL